MRLVGTVVWLLWCGLPLGLGCSSSTDESTGGSAGVGATGSGGSSAGAAGSGAGSGASGGSAGAGAAAGSGGVAGGGAVGGAGVGGSAGSGGAGGDGGSGGSGGVEVRDVSIFVADTCDVTTTPASITVALGTSFTVNWINLASSASPADVDKIDQYNQVPIVIGLEPGQSYHDSIREWCGQLYTGIFWFRVTGCYDPYLLEVDCGG